VIYRPGQLFRNSADPDLGWVRIVDVEPGRVQVESILGFERRTYATKSNPLVRAQIVSGCQVQLAGSGSWQLVISSTLLDGFWEFHTDNGSFAEWQILGLKAPRSLLDDWDQSRLGAPTLVDYRVRALSILRKRRQNPWTGMLGARVNLLSHQLWTVSKALSAPSPRRSLFADEVGLGKTIEAGLLAAHLHSRGELSTALVVVPDALKVQWLTEFFRRFHLRFRLDHEDMLDSADHRDWVISSLSELTDREASPMDLIIVDEAHRLLKSEEHRSRLRPWCQQAQNLLFLTATPELYGDSAFGELLALMGQTESGPTQTRLFRSRRRDLGLQSLRRLELIVAPTQSELEAEIVSFFLKALGEKTKVFALCRSLDVLERWKKILEARVGRHFAIFHENLSLVDRDRQAAFFANPDGAPFLISTEIGGEGRNFQFCSELIFLDLPDDPWLVEQRIGRLDRIGQKKQVTVWVPFVAGSPDEVVFEKLRDETRVFSQAWSGAAHEDGAEPGGQAQARDFSSVVQSFEAVSKELGFDSTALEFSSLNLKRFRELIIGVYDAYGVHLEDLDTEGSITASITNLSFVEALPTLQDQNQRSMALSRTRALEREDWMWMSPDHPEAVELLEFFIQGDLGRLTCVERPETLSRDSWAWVWVDGDWFEYGKDSPRVIAEPKLESLRIARPKNPSLLRERVATLPLQAEAAIIFDN
jgi:ATP-dependent helicase HepA